jgi:hypothetical protein
MAVDPKSKLVVISKPNKIQPKNNKPTLVVKPEKKNLIVEDNKPALVVKKDEKTLVIEDNKPALVVRKDEKILAFAAQQGLPGVPGDGVNLICGEDIDFGNVCYLKTDNKTYNAGYLLPELISDYIPTFFMAQGSGISGQEVFFKYGGEITFPQPVLLPGQVYYLGENGHITPTPPTSGLMLVIGRAITESLFLLRFQESILLR